MFEVGAKFNLAVGVPHAGAGTETFIRRYCEHLSPQSTSLVCYALRNDWRFAGDAFVLDRAWGGYSLLWKSWRALQKILRIESPFGDPFIESKLVRFLERHETSVFFSQYLPFGWSIAPICKKLGLRHVVRGHGYDLSEVLNSDVWRQRFLSLNEAHAIVVPTEYQRNNLIRIGLNADIIHATPCGVDIPGSDALLNSTHGKETIECLVVGRLTPKKAPDITLKAFFAAAERMPRLRLTMVGDGILRSKVEGILKAHPLAHLVKLSGALPHAEVKKMFQQAHIFLQHSVTPVESGDQEGAPVAIMEAMAHALPVVSTRHAGIPYLVENEQTGLLTDEFDEAGMSDCIVRLAQDASLRETLGKRGRMKAAAEFSWEKERDRLLPLLRG